MPGESVKVSGSEDLQRALQDLGKATGKNVLRRVGRKMLQPMMEAAKAVVRRRSGALEKAIVVGTRLAPSQRGASRNVAGGSGFRADPKNDVTLHMGPGQQPQAITEEFGKFNQAPSPFMRPAFDAHAGPAINSAGTELWAEIAKASARRAKKAAKAAGL